MSKDMKQKQYWDLTDAEKYTLKEYQSWCESDAPIAYKITQATYGKERLISYGITHLIHVRKTNQGR